MIAPYQIVIFLFASLGIIWVSRTSLRNIQHHGFFRFFAWESILTLILLNLEDWFADPFSLRQIISWTFLTVSLALIIQGVRQFRQLGSPDLARHDPALVGIEKTTKLVTSGVYRYIRHPFYSSLLFLGWGAMLKKVSWTSLILALFSTAMLITTARKEERENVVYFGDPYREYMRDTKMFIPFIF